MFLSLSLPPPLPHPAPPGPIGPRWGVPRPAPPGAAERVHASIDAAAALLVAKCDICHFTPVGKVQLAKAFGEVELYKLERA